MTTKWSPKYIDLKLKAKSIARVYMMDTAEGKKSFDVIQRLAKKYNMSIKSVYRYLSFAKVSLQGRNEKKQNKETIDKKKELV